MPRLSRADLRFRVPGFASRFYWDVDLARSDHDIGTLRLRPGGSVVGHVTLASRGAPEDVIIRLLPARQSPFVPLDADRRDETVEESHPNARGMFSLEGLDPGVYRVVAIHPELAPAEVTPVRVTAGGQTEIAEPLVLTPALPLRLNLDPLFDPDKADWRLEIARDDTGSGTVLEATTAAGYLETPPIALGTYSVRVLDGRGEEMVRHEVTHTVDAGLHTLKVDIVRVVGSVSLGGEPLVARLGFVRLAADLTAASDDEGAFALYLPAEGVWDVKVEAWDPVVRWRRADVEVTAEDGIARLDLALLDTQLSGVVVDESGRPHEGATVDVAEAAPTGRTVSLETDALGRFLFHGLEEDRYRVAATDHQADLSSESESVELVEGTDPELHLVLRKKKHLEARIVDSTGNPLPNTWIEAHAFTASGAADPLADLARSSDARGHVRLSLRTSTETVLLTVLAPGFAVRALTLEPGNAGDIVVQPEGGTVEVEVPAGVGWTAPGVALPAVVLPTGQRIAFGALAQWARLNGVTNDPQGTRFMFPALEAGTYRACWVRPSDFANRSTLGLGCVAGQLQAAGSLELRMESVPPKDGLKHDA